MPNAKKTSASSSYWGFDVRELDTSIRPQDDFYSYVNKKWMEQNPIPDNESRWGSFMILRYDTDKRLYSLLTELLKKKAKPGSPEQLIGDFYRSGMDSKRRNTLGHSPIQHLLAEVAALKNSKQLGSFIAKMHVIGTGGLWGAGIDQDSKNTDQYALHLVQGGLGMPDRDYYLKDDPESVRVRTAYELYIKKLFRLIGRSAQEAEAAMQTVMRLETGLAAISMAKEDMRDPDKTYHKMTLAKLQKLSPSVDWQEYFKRTGVKKLETAIVMQPDFFAGVSTQLTETSLEDWKVYFTWHVVSDYAGALSDPFVKASFDFYGKVLSGMTKMRPRWRRVLTTVNGGLGELIGRIYVDRYFPKEAKKKMDILVDDLFTAYRNRIQSLEWMTSATKKKALTKLNALNRKIGYPRRWKSYTGLCISAQEYVGNIIRMNEFEHKRELKKLSRPIDRDEWFMYPQTVNAYFAPNMNDIVFPAAILQPPFFDMRADDAVNYGSIGAVIGHEITHGFDDEGSKFDAKGNLKSWWSAEDRKRFDAKAKKVEKQFNGYEVADGLKVNGKLTLGENIADLGGLSIAYDAYQLQLARTGRADIDGLTPEQRFFIAFAVFERENSRPESVKTRVLTDPHSPGEFRINGPVSNFNHFYAAYNVKPGDKHYRAPKEREMVW